MLLFNTILNQFGINPAEVLLLRHQEHRGGGRTPYDLWRDDRLAFDDYQSRQARGKRSMFSKASLWAAFVVTPQAETLFVGLYASSFSHELETSCPHPLGGVETAGNTDCYLQSHEAWLENFEGRLIIDWGPGYKAWAQWAKNQNKPILELRREFKEPDFPGFNAFIKPLSEIANLPSTWVSVLKNAKGVYLLTCARTREQYVGAAYGGEGFWNRWMAYVVNSHGGNLGLRSRQPSDYQVSILEVLGSSATDDDVIAAEALWKQKLQSREMGLNMN